MLFDFQKRNAVRGITDLEMGKADLLTAGRLENSEKKISKSLNFTRDFC